MGGVPAVYPQRYPGIIVRYCTVPWYCRVQYIQYYSVHVYTPCTALNKTISKGRKQSPHRRSRFREKRSFSTANCDVFFVFERQLKRQGIYREKAFSRTKRVRRKEKREEDVMASQEEEIGSRDQGYEEEDAGLIAAIQESLKESESSVVSIDPSKEGSTIEGTGTNAVNESHAEEMVCEGGVCRLPTAAKPEEPALFFRGDVGTAVSTAKNEEKLLVVYIDAGKTEKNGIDNNTLALLCKYPCRRFGAV